MAPDYKKDSIAVVLYPGCILLELTVAMQLLGEKFRLVVLSPDGGTHVSSLGLNVETSPYSTGLPDDCRAVLIPGGEFSSLVNNSAIDTLLRDAAEGGCVIAAICGGVFAPAKAGILKGHSFVHPFSREQMEFLAGYFSDCHPVDADFLHDGIFLTAKPHAFIDFAVELAARLQAIPKDRVIFFKNYYRGFPQGRIRPLSLAILRRPNGQMLLHNGIDRATGQRFYRPLGGGIDFGESAKTTIEREMEEEIGEAVEVGRLAGALENHFTFEHIRGHELIFIYEARFLNPGAYERDVFEIDESGTSSGTAVWRSLEEIRKENLPLYPRGLEPLL